VQEEDALAEAPQRRRPELIAARPALQNVIGEPRAIWCSDRSEYRDAVRRRRAATVALPVVSVGVWQCTHPTFANCWRPRAIDNEPPGVSGDAVGGARKRWKLAKFSMAPISRTLAVTSLGTVAN
jgi:hypothetical protein